MPYPAIVCHNLSLALSLARVLIRVGGPPNRWGGPTARIKGTGQKLVLGAILSRPKSAIAYKYLVPGQLFPSQEQGLPAAGAGAIGAEPAVQLGMLPRWQGANTLFPDNCCPVKGQESRPRALVRSVQDVHFSRVFSIAGRWLLLSLLPVQTKSFRGQPKAAPVRRQSIINLR